MTNYDMYDLDVNEIINNEKRSKGAKVKWHTIKKDGQSVWRFLPWVKKRTFYLEQAKHWNIPGFTGSLLCPRAAKFITGKECACAMCDKRWELFKSKDPGDKAIADVLRNTSAYYVNAVRLDVPENEQEVGVLELSYTLWLPLFNFLSVEKLRTFTHPTLGRNIIINAQPSRGAVVPNSNNKSKTTYSIMNDDISPLRNMAWLEQIYDLDEVPAYPTYEYTQACLQKILTGDPEAGNDSINQSKKFFRLSDTASTEQAPPIVSNSQSSHVAVDADVSFEPQALSPVGATTAATTAASSVFKNLNQNNTTINVKPHPSTLNDGKSSTANSTYQSSMSSLEIEMRNILEG